MLPAASQPVFARRLPSDAEVKALEQRLNYNFNNTWGLKLALVHPSYGELNNARLTWLGDAVLGAAVSDLLYQALPDATIAGLHDHRMAIVRRKACAAAARKLGLDRLLVVGKGYEGAEPTMAMLAGERCRRHCFEAVWGAIYEDAGFQLGPMKKVYAALFPLGLLPPAQLA
ncbi:hypothetical protein CHLNCDRAFT_140869 [Chlorella variabilis]|uniref:RNase III domain-containing protein n=1 Tax=Chlorella variabilis TaxID=554065 RepID=E1Z6E3_CHLVA|nr:hypothetical protein CHLNCDRAFT_140869 [Chlorella variabilis]EFN58917.1 hypothetical protein CHLNCDRAFT_140869 [Chlorella variabilis]|eukprot:XP_005851019.1 hypothetical protein CHLNCDRAFT_140869 [Chlorella variabilis]